MIDAFEAEYKTHTNRRRLTSFRCIKAGNKTKCTTLESKREKHQIRVKKKRNRREREEREEKKKQTAESAAKSEVQQRGDTDANFAILGHDCRAREIFVFWTEHTKHRQTKRKEPQQSNTKQLMQTKEPVAKRNFKDSRQTARSQRLWAESETEARVRLLVFMSNTARSKFQLVHRYARQNQHPGS